MVELTNENEALKAKLHLMLSRVNMKETEMEHLFEEEQRLGHICLVPTTLASNILSHRGATSDDDEEEHSSRMNRPKNSSASEAHDDNDDDASNMDESQNARAQHPLLYNQLLGSSNESGAVDLSRTEVTTGNLLTTVAEKSPSPVRPSSTPPNESLLQILANQILKTKPHDSTAPASSSTRLLTIASPTETKSNPSTLKRNLNQLQQDEADREQDQQQRKWDEAAMTLLSLNKPPAPPVEQQKALQSVCQSVINGLLRKPAPPRATIDYHSHHSMHHQQMQGENLHHHHHQNNLHSLEQLKTLMNYFSTSSNPSFPMASLQAPSTCISEQSHQNNRSPANIHSQSQEPRGDMMPLKLRMKMLNAKT